MKHRACTRFWDRYHRIPVSVRRADDLAYAQLRRDSRHSALHFKKVGRFWSVCVGLHFRALATDEGTELVWFWIGTHAEYDRIIGHA